MPAGNPQGYKDLDSVARAFNANPRAVPGFQAILDDLASFAGLPIAERPENFSGPPSPMDFPASVRERLARQALDGDVDMSGVDNAQGVMGDIRSMLKRLRGGLPDARLAERIR